MKVLVGMSGGIDSSVTAQLLINQGYEVEGATMVLWNDMKHLAPSKSRNCCYSPDKTEDLRKTREICDRIGIRHHVIDLSHSYRDIVLGNFRDEYLNGRTPNPCIWCNSFIKFGKFLEAARESGIQFDCFATGHYAKIKNENGRYFISRAEDRKKDQSYFLYRLSQEQLAHTLFPLGTYTKDTIREIDVEYGFHEEGQSESQDFYSGDYSEIIGKGSQPGNIVDLNGNVVGHHDGIFHYTVGQRKGLGIAAPRPLYVLEIRADSNEVVVGYEEDTWNHEVTATNIVMSKYEVFDKKQFDAKIRSTGNPVPVTASCDGNVITAHFTRDVKAATLGQSLVLYEGDDIVGGGIICDVK